MKPPELSSWKPRRISREEMEADVDWEPRRITREELEASFKPCCYCGRVEQWEHGVYRIHHDYSKHPGMEPRREKRLSTEELMQLPNPDFAPILDQNPRYSLGISEANTEKRNV